jgi:meiosis induction protein kinase IME2/SME1
MAPHTIDEFLPAPEWPTELCDFITWCLAWDPNARPTATDAMHHQYFADAIDPLRPKSAASTRILGRKTPDIETAATNQDVPHTLNNRRSSWFRRSLVARESAPVVPQQRHATPRLASPSKAEPCLPIATSNTRPVAPKRATWTVGSSQYGAPMPFLPAIKPISPMPNAVHAEAKDSFTSPRKEEPSATLSRQLSMLSQQTSTSDMRRQEAERVLNGRNSRQNLRSASAAQKDGFFSHFRKRTRRSGMPATPRADDLEPGQHATWRPAQQSMLPDLQTAMVPAPSQTDFGDIDNALRNIQYRLSPTKTSPTRTTQYDYGSTPILKRQPSKPLSRDQAQNSVSPLRLGSAASSLRANQRAMQRPGWFSQRRRAPSEQPQQQDYDVSLDHALGSAAAAMARLEQQQNQYTPQQYPSAPIYRKSSRPSLRPSASTMGMHKGPYPTPSPSTRHDGDNYNDWTKTVDMRQHESQALQHHQGGHPFPTPPYDDGNMARACDDPWAAAAAVAIAEAGQAWR